MPSSSSPGLLFIDKLLSLVAILKNKPSAQMSYQAALCFWLLSFDTEIAQTINASCDVIPLLLDIAQSAVKEKVIRVVMATFRVCHNFYTIAAEPDELEESRQ
jgi:hypothetical protein